MRTRAWFGWMVKKPMSSSNGTTHTPTIPTTRPSVCAAVVTGVSSGGIIMAPATMAATNTAVATTVSSSIGQPLRAWTVLSTLADPSGRDTSRTDMMVPP